MLSARQSKVGKSKSFSIDLLQWLEKLYMSMRRPHVLEAVM